MSDKLNAKQEAFIQAIVSGLSQRQAYKQVYKVEYDENAIDINASKLFNSTKVQLRYKELLEKIEEESIMTAKQRMKWLSDLIRDENSNTDKLKAIDILNKMTGEYTSKVDLQGAIPVIITGDDEIAD